MIKFSLLLIVNRLSFIRLIKTLRDPATAPSGRLGVTGRHRRRGGGNDGRKVLDQEQLLFGIDDEAEAGATAIAVPDLRRQLADAVERQDHRVADLQDLAHRDKGAASRN